MRYTVIVLAVLLMLPYASASYITISAQLAEMTISGSNAEGVFSVSNSGDEPAYSVQTSFLSAPGAVFPTLFIERLDPGKRVDTPFNANITKTLLPGKYPVAVLTEYADANNYPFSAVSYSFLTNNERTSSDVTGTFGEAKVQKGGAAKIKLSIVNRGAAAHNVTLIVLTSKELLAGGYAKTVTLNSEDQKSMNVEISSLSALEGSTYNVFAVMEYDNNGKHFSSFARGSVAITKNEGLFSVYIIAGLLVVLAASIFAYNFRLKRK
ncbi:MAG: hypothetical protein V1836_03260 [Candidatus Aenigmatarchaeota archaeon]